MVDRNQKYEDILSFYCIFRAFGSFYCDVVILNVHVCLGRTKTRSPEFGTVLHWRPPDVHIFHTDPSLVHTKPRTQPVPNVHFPWSLAAVQRPPELAFSPTW